MTVAELIAHLERFDPRLPVGFLGEVIEHPMTVEAVVEVQEGNVKVGGWIRPISEPMVLILERKP